MLIASYIKRDHVALLALFFAIRGTAFAAGNALLPGNSVGTTTCTKSSMAKDEAAGFIITYKVSASIANGSDLSSTDTIGSDTTEAGSANNTTDSTVPALLKSSCSSASPVV